MGATKKPYYRVVVTDSRSPRDGRFIEEVGYYQPRQEPAGIKLNENRIKYWISTGAKPSEPVKELIRKSGLKLS